MDASRKPRARAVPTYGLYGEAGNGAPDFWIHSETIRSRSQLHNWEIRSHRHENFHQLLLVRDGTGDVIVEGDIHRLSPSTLVSIPPLVTHGFRFSHDIEGDVVTIVAARLAERAGNVASRSVLETPRLFRLAAQEDDDQEFVLRTFDRITRELDRGFGARYNLIGSHLEVILTLLAEVAPPQGASGDGRDRDRERIRKLDQLISLHFRQHQPIEFYAAALSVSPTHLNRICRAVTGRAVRDLLADRIISQARRDLVFTINPVQEIAYSLGFTDPAYFTRYFTRQTGEPPFRFRKREQSSLGTE